MRGCPQAGPLEGVLYHACLSHGHRWAPPELPICKVTDDLYIGAFICFGDAELTVACARDMLAMLEADSYDYLFTAEAKSIPLIHEMARQSGAKKYFIARKGPKAYMPDPLHVEDKSITTAGVQKLYLGRDDADLIRGQAHRPHG